MIWPVDALTFLESSIAAISVPSRQLAVAQNGADADAEQNSAEHDGKKLRACHGRDELAALKKAGERSHCNNRAQQKTLAQCLVADEEKRNVYDYNEYTQPYSGKIIYHHAHARDAAVEYRIRDQKAFDRERGARSADDYHDNGEEVLFEKVLHSFTILFD